MIRTGLLLALVLAGCAALAQDYPTRPVRMVVPFPPGGSNDIVARLMAQKLGELLGQQFITDNRGGAGGVIGAQIAAKAAPDGYTILLTNPGPSIHNVLLRKQPSYTIADFAPIVHIGSAASIIVGNPRLPAANVRELVAYAKANPGKVKWASSGNNSNPHISLEVLKLATGIDVLHVPYKGTSAALTDVISGEVDAMFTSIISAEPYFATRRLKVLGYAGTKRQAAIPDVQTLTEQGIRGVNVATWFGLVTTARTPRAVIDKLNAAANHALRVPEIRQRLEHLGLEVAGGAPEKLGAFMKNEADNLSRLIKAGALRVEP